MTNGTPTPDDSRSDPRYQHPGGADPERADRLSREDRFEDSLAQTWDTADAATDRLLVHRLSESVRGSIQEMLDDLLGRRKSVLFG